MRWVDIEAAKALVQQVPLLADVTYLTRVPRADGTAVQPLPYAVLHPIGGTPQAMRETGPEVTEFPSFTLHVVGGSVEQVSALSDLLYPVLMPEVHPTVSGRKTSRIWWREPLPIQEDTDVNPTLLYAVIEFGWRSDPV